MTNFLDVGGQGDVSGAILDATGLYCPEPVMMLHNRVRDMGLGEIVTVLATDPSTQRDIPKFCQFLGHELLEMRSEVSTENSDESVYIFVLKKVKT